MRRFFLMSVVAAFAVVFAPAAFAATATPFGGATVNDGILTLVSNTGDAGATNDASGATFADTGVTTFASITQLSAEFNVTDDDCSAGSPRFQIRVQTPSGEKNVFVYLDPTPTASGGCAVNTWLSTGNLIASTTAGQYDTSQVQGGTQVSNYAQALALVGSYPVTSISLVVDSGWAFTDKEQTVLIRNVRINSSTFYTGQSTPPPNGSKGLNPAQACKALRSQMGAAVFRATYGTNANGANAYGKCVSRMAREKNDAARAAAVTRIDKAAAKCAKQHAAKNGKAKGIAKQKRFAACLKKTA